MGQIRFVIRATFNGRSHINIGRLTVARLKGHNGFGDYGVIHR